MPAAEDADARGAPTSPAPDTAELASAGSLLARVAIARLAQLAHPHGGGWTDFWLEPGVSTSWVSAYAASALADAAEAPGVSGGQRAIADALVLAATDRLLVTQRDGTWGWAPDLPPDADSTAWAVRALVAAGRVVPERSWTFLDRYLGPAGASTHTEPATGIRTDPMPEVTALVLDVLAARRPTSDLDERWSRLLASGPQWTSHWWAGSDHPTVLVLDAWRRRTPHAGHDTRPGHDAPQGDPLRGLKFGRGAGADPARARAQLDEGGAAGLEGRETADTTHRVSDPTDATQRVGDLAESAYRVSDLADTLWCASLLGRPEPALAWAILDAQLPAGGWAGDTHVLVPAQSGDHPPRRTVDARGVFTTATVLHAAVALLRALPAGSVDSSAQPGIVEAGGARSAETSAPDGTVPIRSDLRQAGARSAHPRDERWDGAITRVAVAQGVSPQHALDVFRALTRESLAAGSPWPSAQLSSLASGMPVELSAGSAPGLRFTCEVGDPRLPPPGRLRSGLLAVERTAQLLGMGEAWAGRRSQLLGVLADTELPVPEDCRFWLWAGVDLPASGSAVLRAYLSLHAGDVDDWRSRLQAALRMLAPGGSIWPALACLRGAARCHTVGIGELPGGHWGLTVYFELDRWRPDLLGELIATCALPTTVDELTPDIPGVLRPAHRGQRRTGFAMLVDPVTGDVTELTTTVAVPAALVGNAVLAERVATWLEQRGQDSGPLRAVVAAVESDWADADPLAGMFGLIALSGGRRGASATVYVRPRAAAGAARPVAVDPASGLLGTGVTHDTPATHDLSHE